MPKRSSKDAVNAPAAAHPRLAARAADLDAQEPSKDPASHERVRPEFAQLMSAFASYLASTQPPVEAALVDGITSRSLLLQMSKLFSQGDVDAALAVADGVAASHAAHDVASYCARTCRTELEGDYRERLGRLDHAPRQTFAHDDLSTCDLDPREAFLLSQVDGRTSYAALVDVSPLPRFTTLSILERLLKLGLIE